MITKTRIGNHLRKHPNGDVDMYRNGFKDGVAWAQAQSVTEPKHTTGHCKELGHRDGCQLHKSQCEYPKCDRKETV
jgi:hypothetical protein